MAPKKGGKKAGKTEGKEVEGEDPAKLLSNYKKVL
jgi:hypothetical protein